MSIDANPSIKEIATTFGDTPPYSMSELYGLNFSSGNAVVSGTISLSGFSNKTVERMLVETRIVASDKADSDFFGSAVSISSDGSTALVGAYGVNDGTSNDEGAAYIYEKVNGTWTERAKLTTSEGLQSDWFGLSVTISSDGSTALVGAHRVDDGTSMDEGAAYIYEKPGNGWTTTSTYTAKLTVSDGAANDNFGRSVSISSDGSTALVGAYAVDGDGAAYIYEKPEGGWATTSTYTAKLTTSEGLQGDVFGFSVSISGDGSTALVGAYGVDDGASTNEGVAYIYEKPGSGWTTTSTYTAKLATSEGAGGDFFGYSVSISGDGSTALVGAYGMDDGTSLNEGAAYIYEKPEGGWTTTSTYTAKLTTSEGAQNDYFGYSVSISGDGSMALVGAHGVDDGTSMDEGAAYIYEKPGNGWTTTPTYTSKLTTSEGLQYDIFGRAVSISSDGSTSLVGAYGVDDGASGNEGAAYIYEPTYFVN